MPGPKTIDQLAIAVRDDLRHRPHMAGAIQPPARHFAAVLRQELPDVPRTHVAAVLLHLSRLLVHTHYEMARDQALTKSTALLHLASMPGVIGEHLHTGYQLAPVPTTADDTPHGHCPVGCTFHTHQRVANCQRCDVTFGQPTGDTIEATSRYDSFLAAGTMPTSNGA